MKIADQGVRREHYIHEECGVFGVFSSHTDKEISYIHAESYAAGELKHGTIALIDDRQPVIALCCNTRLQEKTSATLSKLKLAEPRCLLLHLRIIKR